MGVAFSPDSRYVATAGLEGSAHLWAEQDSAETQAALVQSPVYGDIKSVAFSPDGSRLALGGTDNSIKMVDAASGDVLHTLAGHNGKALAEALVGICNRRLPTFCRMRWKGGPGGGSRAAAQVDSAVGDEKESIHARGASGAEGYFLCKCGS